jgi:hypothetical protein
MTKNDFSKAKLFMIEGVGVLLLAMVLAKVVITEWHALFH